MSIIERIKESYENKEVFSPMKEDVEELSSLQEKYLVYKETLKHIVQLGESHISPQVLMIAKETLKEEVEF